MKASGGILSVLAAQFFGLSLMAFGGANAVVPKLQREVVDVHHWMGDRDFAALFAIAQAAPGPNVMISTLVGWKVAGLAGALVATFAMCAPACVLAVWVAKIWDRYREAPLRAALATGLAPVTVGLIGASAYLLIRAADANLRLGLVTAAAAGVAYFTKYNPLWCLAAAAGLGLTGVLR